MRLRNRQVGGAKFRRQQVIGPYVVDFFCHDARLVVEVDGAQHRTPLGLAQDAERTQYLASLGLRVLRFDNADVLFELESVLETIWQAIWEAPSP